MTDRDFIEAILREAKLIVRKHCAECGQRLPEKPKAEVEAQKLLEKTKCGS